MKQHYANHPDKAKIYKDLDGKCSAFAFDIAVNHSQCLSNVTLLDFAGSTGNKNLITLY